MRQSRLYSLFSRPPREASQHDPGCDPTDVCECIPKRQRQRWIRISTSSFPLASAVKIYQSALLASCLQGWPERQLRVVSREDRFDPGALDRHKGLIDSLR